ncbi:hypothetical protein LTSEMON_3513, partial [Salmonella enterica subsp. enterica serovar Montevideo str. S5-403]
MGKSGRKGIDKTGADADNPIGVLYGLTHFFAAGAQRYRCQRS